MFKINMYKLKMVYSFTEEKKILTDGSELKKKLLNLLL